MRRFFSDLPVLASLRALFAFPRPRSARSDRAARPERGAIALYIAIAAAGVVALATPLSRALASELIAVHHFRPKSWPAWAGLQLVPKMYSFAHTCWIGPAPLLEQEPRIQSERRFARESFWVNHYPARKARFDAGREELGLGAERFVYLRSSYFDLTETTGFHVRIEPGRLVLTRREGVQ
jgi:hypothetical protein